MPSKARGRTDQDRVAELEAAAERRTRDLQAALEQRSNLLHELDHRVKNNLQLISSLMLLQARRASDPAVKAALGAMQGRLAAVGVVHRRLFQSEDVTCFDVSDFLRDMVAELSGPSARQDVEIVCRLEPALVPAAKAAPLALLINELLTNAFQHAFPDGRAGRLSIAVVNDDTGIGIEIADNGVGTAVGGQPGGGQEGFGLTIVELLAKQLQARVAREDSDPGLRVTVKLPRDNHGGGR